MSSEIDGATFRRVLGNYPTGVCAVTAFESASAPIALVVGSFTSVSLDPPLVGFLPDRRSTSWPRIEATGRFCINVLGSDQTPLCKQIASPVPDKLAGVGYTSSPLGSPLLDDVLAWIDCELYSVTDAGDHVFVQGRVIEMSVLREADPLLFFRGRYGSFAELA